MDWILDNESTLRLTSFALGYFLFFALGLALPFRAIGAANKIPRWGRNLTFVFGNSFLLKLLIPVSLAGIAIHADTNTLGLFNQFSWPPGFELVLSLILLDLMIYWQHRIFHMVPVLWRMHRLHHTDTELDVTTAGRFHPFEIFLSYLLKAIAVITLGLAPATIILYEVVLNFFALFNHGNFALPKPIEKWTRVIFVTPSMHRVHHSTKSKETNSNYGNCLSCWDRLFSSYIHESAEDPKEMAIGLTEFRSPSDKKLAAMVMQPFSKD